MTVEANSHDDWRRMDYKPVIRDHIPVPVIQHVAPGSTVLDVGCNTGSNAICLAEHGLQVLGIDINPAAIEQARTRANELSLTRVTQFRVANVLEYPVTDQFDVVLLIRILTCFADSSDWTALVQRSTRLLKPQGYLYIHDFLMSPDIEGYRIRYEAGARLGWRTGNFQVNDTRGNRLFIAHHHSKEEVDSIVTGFHTLSYRSHESLSMNGNTCRMCEFLGQRRT